MMDYAGSIHLLIERKALENPAAIAVIFAKQNITYGELNEQANRVANYLRGLGIKPGDKIPLCMQRSIDLVIAIVGILKAEATYVPLDASHPTARLLTQITDIEAAVLIADYHFKNKFLHVKSLQILFVTDATSQLYMTNTSHPVLSKNHLAYIIFTSGTTGKPKGVLVPHETIINYGAWFSEYCQVTPGVRIDWSCNYIFDMAITTSIVALMLGIVIVICSDEIKHNIRHYLNYLRHNKINIIKITPSYFKELLHEARIKFTALPHLTTLILGGENLRSSDCMAWLALYPHHTIYNEYGPTEATVAVSQYKVCRDNLKLLQSVHVPIGKPAPHVSLYILDPMGKPIVDEHAGELYIGGNCLATGYLNQPELNKTCFINNYLSHNSDDKLYKTGDLCKRLTDGSIECVGRIDEQVKIRGFRIDLREIEFCLTANDAINDAVVIARKNDRDENYLVAYYILESMQINPDTKTLCQYLQSQLPSYMIPAIFMQIDEFPLAANGKLDRLSLPEPMLSINQHHILPRLPMEKKLAKIWLNELGLKSIGIKDSFFELGGHSLTAARIISTISRTLKKDISIIDFYNADNIANLAILISNIKQKNEDLSPKNQCKYSKILPLNDFQLMLWLSNIFEPKAYALNIVARKRMQGTLDKDLLLKAFMDLCKKHEILTYAISNIIPAQFMQKNTAFSIDSINIQYKEKHESESILIESMNEMINFHPWKRHHPRIMARLFYLSHDSVELQLCVSHIIADSISIDILFNDLSSFYFAYKHNKIKPLSPVTQFKEYVTYEQNYTHKHIDRDLSFWKNYLRDTDLFIFKPEDITNDTDYSTYIKIPECDVKKLHDFCIEHHVSLNDALCAALGISLVRCCGLSGQKTQNILMNIVKSTRENKIYDKTIGCFIRVDPIKINLNNKLTWSSQAMQVNHSALESDPYQHGSTLLKLACISRLHRENNSIIYLLSSIFTTLYSKFLFCLNLKYKVLSLCTYLKDLHQNNRFIININVWENFINNNENTKKSKMFGLKLKQTPLHQYDLLSLDNVLDVCLLRDEDQNTPWLVISSNLKPELREQIATQILQTIRT